MANALILGDVHLGKGVNIGKSGIGSSLNSRIADQVNLLDWTLDQAEDLFAHDIIITGDVFEETKPPTSLITIFISWLKKCQAHDINVHIIMGNHDILRSGFIYTSPLDIISEVDLDNVFIYKDINTIIIGTTAFTMMPFRDRKSFSVNSATEALSLLKDSLVYELASIPATYTKVLIGHLAIEGSIPVGDEIDDLTNELFCPVDMFTGYNYVWMGHVHKPQVMKKSKPYIAHIGSMDISNFGETDHKKFIVILSTHGEMFLENKDIWGIRYLPTRTLKKVLVVVPKDTVDSTAYVLDELKKLDALDKATVRVEVSLASPEIKSVNKSSIEKYLLSQGVFNVTAISESKKVALIKKDSNNTIDTKMDVASAIKTYANTYVEDKMRPAFIELATEIHTTYKSEAKE
jgi:DNA repair exonuclease SbcCD nuclease subunit